MTSPYHALADMGLQVSMDGQGGLILGGLKSLPPKKRECALALAKKCKAEIVEALGRGKGPTPLPMNWAPDTWEGRPCCYLPHVPERLRGYLQPDLRGMGIPAEGLPAALRGFSRSGWRLVLEKGGKLRMVAAVRDARNENGCRGYLRVNRAAVLQQLEQWEKIK